MRVVPLWFALSAGVCTVSPAAEQFGPQPPEGVPRAVCPQSRFNWRTVFSGEEVLHSYTILNQGTADLKILRVTESCRCTKRKSRRL